MLDRREKVKLDLPDAHHKRFLIASSIGNFGIRQNYETEDNTVGRRSSPMVLSEDHSY